MFRRLSMMKSTYQDQKHNWEKTMWSVFTHQNWPLKTAKWKCGFPPIFLFYSNEKQTGMSYFFHCTQMECLQKIGSILLSEELSGFCVSPFLLQKDLSVWMLLILPCASSAQMSSYAKICCAKFSLLTSIWGRFLDFDAVLNEFPLFLLDLMETSVVTSKLQPDLFWG